MAFPGSTGCKFATRANSVPGLNSRIFATFEPAYFSTPKAVFSVASGGRKWVRPGKNGFRHWDGRFQLLLRRLSSSEIASSLNIPVDRPYTAVLADGRRVPRQQGWVIMRLQGQQFPSPVTFGEEGEPVLLGAMALEHALLAVDPHGQRLMPVDALEANG